MPEHPSLPNLGGYLPIEDHGVIGDLHTVALVGVNGDIDWCCLPRFDSPSVFGALLDTQRGGRFTLSSRDTVRTKQMYLPDTNVLLTRFLGPDSVAEVVDFMVPHERGRSSDAPHHLVRQLRAARGRVRGQLRCAPAFDYARVRHQVHLVDGVGAVFISQAGRLVLRSTIPLHIDGDAVVAEPILEEGESVELALSWGGAAQPLRPEQVQTWLADTERYWRRWIHQSRYQGRYRETVERSALVLKLLVHDPTGALVAAPTTSLPEAIGGSRNWDYRYTWVRDAAFTLYALMRLGLTSEAGAFMTWLEARCRVAADGDGLQTLYGVDGRRDLPEQTLDHLAGYAGTRPVRIGNAATSQRQLDIHGELMDSVYLFNKYGEPISYDLWDALRHQLDWLANHWEDPDHGIWEMRGPPRRHTYSALMTWVAFERAQRIALQRGLPAPLARWRRLADRAYLHVQRNGWNPERQAYVQHPGTTTLDASALIMPLVKFVGPRDPRFLATLDRIGADLVTDSLVRRYHTDGSDGLPDAEGTFSLCSFWYVEALTRAGRLTQARRMFEQMLTYANHLGLYAEEVGPAGEALGNFPQAFTHLALISAAVNLDRALKASGPMATGTL
jgi:GH15 family glucan-1,4-alpha-glucosidase